MEKMTRRVFLKGAALLPFLPLVNACERDKSMDLLMDLLKKDLTIVINELKKKPPRISTVTTAEGDKFNIELYYQSLVLNEKQVIDVSYAVPQSMSPTAKGDPTFTIVSYFYPTTTNVDAAVTTFIDVNANGLRRDELDRCSFAAYKGTNIVDQSSDKISQQKKGKIQQLNRDYANVVNQVKSKLMEQSLV